MLNNGLLNFNICFVIFHTHKSKAIIFVSPVEDVFEESQRDLVSRFSELSLN